jgi:hypothetical protein
MIDVSSGFGTFSYMLRSLDSSLKSPVIPEHLSLRIEFIQPWIVSTDTNWSHPVLEIWRQMDLILTRLTCSQLRKIDIFAIIPGPAEAHIEMGDMETLVYDRLPFLRAKNMLIVQNADDSDGK